MGLVLGRGCDLQRVVGDDFSTKISHVRLGRAAQTWIPFLTEICVSYICLLGTSVWSVRMHKPAGLWSVCLCAGTSASSVWAPKYTDQLLVGGTQLCGLCTCASVPCLYVYCLICGNQCTYTLMGHAHVCLCVPVYTCTYLYLLYGTRKNHRFTGSGSWPAPQSHIRPGSSQ